MNKLKNFPYFQLFAVATFSAFMGLMIFVLITAYGGRHSGQTGLTMGKMQKMRYETNTTSSPAS
jgi:hypothetical protein